MSLRAESLGDATVTIILRRPLSIVVKSMHPIVKYKVQVLVQPLALVPWASECRMRIIVIKPTSQDCDED